MREANLAGAFSVSNNKRFEKMQEIIEGVIKADIQGDNVECGVLAGGGVYLMALLNKKFNLNRTIWAYDTFTGMTKPTDKDYKVNRSTPESYRKKWELLQKNDHNEWCYCPLARFKHNISKTFGYDNIKIVQGDLSKPIKSLPKRISILRIDVDFYPATKNCLNTFLPLVSPGGAVFMDDVGCWNGAKTALDEYFVEQGKSKLHIIDESCSYFIKDI